MVSVSTRRRVRRVAARNAGPRSPDCGPTPRPAPRNGTGRGRTRYAGTSCTLVLCVLSFAMLNAWIASVILCWLEISGRTSTRRSLM